MKIASSEISVVIQGGINQAFLKACLLSVRRHLPESEVIVSTWDGSQIEPGCEILIDRAVYSPDPGARIMTKEGVLNNTNRQVVSTRAGLSVATRRYALKLRTDFELAGSGFLEVFGRFPVRHPEFCVFEQKIVIPRYATRIETTRRPFIFHPSDIALFGLKSDLASLFDIELVNEADFAWQTNAPSAATRERLVDMNFRSRLVPEQHIFLSALKRRGIDIRLDHPKDANAQLIELSQKLLVNNYIVVDQEAFGARPLKESLKEQFVADLLTCYTEAHYEYSYRHYCDPQHSLSFSRRAWGSTILEFGTYESLIKHGMRAKDHFSSIFENMHKTVSEAIITMAYLFKFIFKMVGAIFKG